ncbi:MAG: rRNA adenine N-6-methyltransferase family protein [Anaerolineae bacterium]
MDCSTDGGRQTAYRHALSNYTFDGLRSPVGGRLDEWESRWAPYDEPTYQRVLSYVGLDDVVLEIGAGDLRLARRLAQRAQQVYAIEMQPGLLSQQADVPHNLRVICADARYLRWPQKITLGVLLMRHCTHVGVYAARLRALGCPRLITNARWRLDVELMDLGPRLPWSDVDFGWYACLCGQTGFVPGSLDQLTTERLDQIHETENCPACS